MEKVTLHDKTFRKSIPYEELCVVFDKVAAEINAAYSGKVCDSDPLVLCCVLNGSIMFTAELLKRLEIPVRMTCIKLASYVGTETTGDVRVDMKFSNSVDDAQVLVIEDIVDTGASIAKICGLLREAGARDVKYCTMLLKPGKYHGSIPIDFVGKEIPNEFIVGFGLDYDEIGRNLKDIYTLDI